MKQNQFVKVVPFMFSLLVVAALVMGIVWITSKPDVIQAKGEWANAQANLFAAQATYHTQLPDILTKATALSVSALLSFAAMVFIVSASFNIVLHKIDRVVGHGLEFEKNEGGTKTTYKLFQSNPEPHKQLSGGRGATDQSLFGRSGGQSLPQGNAKKDGRIRPEERRAPGKNPMTSQGDAQLIQSLTGGIPRQVSKDDPLSMLEHTDVI